MEDFAPTALLALALVLPVAVFWLLMSRSRVSGLVATSIAIATGWALNLAWAVAAQWFATTESVLDDDSTIAIAAAFGWVCPLVLVLVTWLVWRFRANRVDES